jgi:hypothetical protein
MKSLETVIRTICCFSQKGINSPLRSHHHHNNNEVPSKLGQTRDETLEKRNKNKTKMKRKKKSKGNKNK